MAVEIMFSEDTAYGAKEVNQAFSQLITKGVSLYQESQTPDLELAAASETVDNNTGKLNSNACKVVKTESGEYQILPGTAWMKDGSSITIKDEPYILDVSLGKQQYVYLIQNTLNNTIDIRIAETEGESGGVPLAAISADGEISDTRLFAKMKVAPKSANTIVQLETEYIRLNEWKSFQVETNLKDFSHVIFISAESNLLMNQFVTLQNKKEVQIEVYGSDMDDSFIAVLTKDDSILNVKMKHNQGEIFFNYSYTFKFMVF